MQENLLLQLIGRCRNGNAVWPQPLVLPAGDIPMTAFFRSVSASFSTTFCFWAAISSLVFSASLQGEKPQHMETELGSSSANQGRGTRS